MNVMISYHESAQDVADRVSGYLQAEGVPVAVSQGNSGDAGDLWALNTQGVQGNITESTALAVETSFVICPLISLAYQNSKECIKELAYATDIGLTVLPIIVDAELQQTAWLMRSIEGGLKPVTLIDRPFKKAAQQILGQIRRHQSVAEQDNNNPVRRFFFPKTSQAAHWWVRETPSMEALRIGRLLPGDEFQVVGQRGNWLQVKTYNLQGWAKRCESGKFFLLPLDGSSIFTFPVTKHFPYWNIRAEPERCATAIGSIQQGEVFVAVAKNDKGWLKVVHNSLQGWALPRLNGTDYLVRVASPTYGKLTDAQPPTAQAEKASLFMSRTKQSQAPRSTSQELLLSCLTDQRPNL